MKPTPRVILDGGVDSHFHLDLARRVTTKNGQWHRARLCRNGLVKENKEKLYLSRYVRERSFYKIHASEKLPLNYAFVKSKLNLIWSDVICVAIRNMNFWQQTKNNSDPWHKRKWHHMHIRLAVNHSAALKRFNQTTFVALTKFADPQILSQYMTSDYLTSCERKTKHYRFTLVNKHEGTMWSHLIWMSSKESSLRTSKGTLQLLSWGCRLTIPDVRSQFCTVYFMKSAS